jgi:hypothetical protein
MAAQNSNAPLTFEVIYKSIPKQSEVVPAAKLAVSVNHAVSTEELKEIVCRVTVEELHDTFNLLIIQFFRDLEPGQYSPGALPDLEKGDYPFPARLQEARALADYAWSRELTKLSKIYLYVDQSGSRIKNGGIVLFDYKSDCPPNLK